MHCWSNLGLLLAALVLAGCGVLARPQADFQDAEKGLVRALRWGEYETASRYLQPPHAAAFRQRFAALKELRITEVRADSHPVASAPPRRETRLEIAYYRLPSLALQTRVLELGWAYRGGDRWHPGAWRLTGAFPAFP